MCDVQELCILLYVFQLPIVLRSPRSIGTSTSMYFPEVSAFEMCFRTYLLLADVCWVCIDEINKNCFKYVNIYMTSSTEGCRNINEHHVTRAKGRARRGFSSQTYSLVVHQKVVEANGDNYPVVRPPSTSTKHETPAKQVDFRTASFLSLCTRPSHCRPKYLFIYL